MNTLATTALAQAHSIPDFGDLSLQAKAAVIGLIVLSLGAHEAAHAWVAFKCGDPTARDLGRITLNPIAHIDPVMTILVPILLVIFTGFLFGGARPVPVNFHNLRRPHRDMALVAIAGPLTNFLIAMLLYGVWHALNVAEVYTDKALFGILFWAALWNLVLAAFNLLPVPPLDGSRVLTWLLPRSLRGAYQSIEPFGMFIIIALMMSNMMGGLLWNTIDVMYQSIRFIVTLGGLW
jgi:Zn-dependent protease